MYPVSEAFLRAVQENTRRYYWTGEIRAKGGAVYPFGCGDIVKGSGYIAAQCCGSAEIELGTVYAAEMGISLFSRIDRRALEGAGIRLMSIYPENDIETYRDVLYFVGQVLGGFFCINREGRLELRKYGAEPVMELGSRQRFCSSFSDFVTRYTAVSSTNLRTQTAEYYTLETDEGGAAVRKPSSNDQEKTVL